MEEPQVEFVHNNDYCVSICYGGFSIGEFQLRTKGWVLVQNSAVHYDNDLVQAIAVKHAELVKGD